MPLGFDSLDDVLSSLSNLGSVVVDRFLTTILIVVAALVALRLLRKMVAVVVQRALQTRREPGREVTQKAHTLGAILESTGRFIILTIAVLMILDNLGVNVTPLLASAGIVGLGISLGAQSLIRDMINGFLILFEDQFGVGDFVRVGQISGTVEVLTLRRTVLRAADGAAVSIPNGDVRTVENLSKGWSRALVEVGVKPEADEQTVLAVFHAVLDNIQQDPVIGTKITEPPRILGVTAVSPDLVTYRALVRTEPLAQWEVERELGRRVRAALAERGVPLQVAQLDSRRGP